MKVILKEESISDLQSVINKGMQEIERLSRYESVKRKALEDTFHDNSEMISVGLEVFETEKTRVKGIVDKASNMITILDKLHTDGISVDYNEDIMTALLETVTE